MALTTPTTYDDMTSDVFFGLTEADKDPLNRLLLNTNYFYGRHSPPLVQFSPYAANATNNSEVFIVPASWSADGLEYTAAVNFWRSDTSAVTLAVEVSGTGTGSWSAVTGSPFTLIASGGSSGDAAATFTFTPVLARVYLKLTITNATGGAYSQLQSFMAYPSTVAVTTGEKASGFIGYEDTHLATTAAAIHTEYFNRAEANMFSVFRDRRQVVASFVQSQGFPGRLTASATATAVKTFPLTLTMPCFLPFDLGTLTVQVLANDSGAGGSVTVHQLGHTASVSLAADGTPNAGSMTFKGKDPVLVFTAEVDTQLDVSYIVVTWQPTAAHGDFLNDVAPPARLEYLLTLNEVIEKRVASAYTVPAMAFNPASKGGTYWNWQHRIPPATYAMRGMRAVHQEPIAGAPAAITIFNTSSGTSGVSAIVSGQAEFVPSWPPTGTSIVVPGSMEYEASPTMAMDRLHEMPAASWTAQNESFYGLFFHSTGGAWIRVADLSTV